MHQAISPIISATIPLCTHGRWQAQAKTSALILSVSTHTTKHVRNMEKLCMLLLTPNATEELAKVRSIEELLELDAKLDA